MIDQMYVFMIVGLSLSIMGAVLAYLAFHCRELARALLAYISMILGGAAMGYSCALMVLK